MTVLCENIDPDGDTLIIIPYSTVSSESSGTSVVTGELSGVGDDAVTELRFKVSRNHLTLASRRARRMFQGEYLETQKSEIDGFYHWKMEPLFDSEALRLVLQIIHAQNQDLPEDVTLEMLVSIGKVVDDLQCHEALSFFAKVWTNRISKPIPGYMCNELIQWIFVASVFKFDKYLKTATRVALVQSTGHIDSLGLPIISNIIGKIEKKRQDLRNDLADRLRTSLDNLCSGSHCDTPQCTYGMIGVLAKNMNDLKLLLPATEAAFSKMSLSLAFRKVRNFDSSPLYIPSNITTKHAKSSYHSSGSEPKENVWMLQEVMYRSYPEDVPKQLAVHQCSLQTLLEPKIDELETQTRTTNLTDV